jgi:methylmalonyl-CoA mutase
MNDTSRPPLVYKPVNKVRFVTAALVVRRPRRIDQHHAPHPAGDGCEVIHLGHNRSVEEIVNCALQEDAHGIAISSYQGGHVDFFKYMLDLLRERGGADMKVFGGGGGVIVPSEIRSCTTTASTRIFSPRTGKARAAGNDQRDRRRVRCRPREGLADRPRCAYTRHRFARTGALAG